MLPQVANGEVGGQGGVPECQPVLPSPGKQGGSKRRRDHCGGYLEWATYGPFGAAGQAAGTHVKRAAIQIWATPNGASPCQQQPRGDPSGDRHSLIQARDGICSAATVVVLVGEEPGSFGEQLGWAALQHTSLPEDTDQEFQGQRNAGKCPRAGCHSRCNHRLAVHIRAFGQCHCFLTRQRGQISQHAATDCLL
jgi:hypothetical protein